MASGPPANCSMNFSRQRSSECCDGGCAAVAHACSLPHLDQTLPDRVSGPPKSTKKIVCRSSCACTR
jgi:hypothetical protein